MEIPDVERRARERKFLVILLLPKPKQEHAGIKRQIEDWSRGNCELAFAGPGVIAYLFTTDRPPSELDFARTTFREDSFLVVELGDGFHQQGREQAGHWLARNRLYR